jgi:hypothetical protein
MPGARLPLRKIREVLRLSAAGMSKRKIAASRGVTATASIRRARRPGLAWPLSEEIADLIASPPANTISQRSSRIAMAVAPS